MVFSNTFHLDLRRAYRFCYLLGIVVSHRLGIVVSSYHRLSSPSSLVTVILTVVSRHRRLSSPSSSIHLSPSTCILVLLLLRGV